MIFFHSVKLIKNASNLTIKDLLISPINSFLDLFERETKVFISTKTGLIVKNKRAKILLLKTSLLGLTTRFIQATTFISPIDSQFTQINQCRWEGFDEGKNILKEYQNSNHLKKALEFTKAQKNLQALEQSSFHVTHAPHREKMSFPQDPTIEQGLDELKKLENKHKTNFLELDKNIMEIYQATQIQAQLLKHAFDFPNNTLSRKFPESIDNFDNQNLFGYKTSFLIPHRRHHLLKIRLENWMNACIDPALKILSEPYGTINSLKNLDSEKIKRYVEQKSRKIYQDFVQASGQMFKSSEQSLQSDPMVMAGRKVDFKKSHIKSIKKKSSTILKSNAFKSQSEQDFQSMLIEKAKNNPYFFEKHFLLTDKKHRQSFNPLNWQKPPSYYAGKWVDNLFGTKMQTSCFYANPIAKAYQLKNPQILGKIQDPSNPKKTLDICQGIAIKKIVTDAPVDIQWFKKIYEKEKSSEHQERQEAQKELKKTIALAQKELSGGDLGVNLFKKIIEDDLRADQSSKE